MPESPAYFHNATIKRTIRQQAIMIKNLLDVQHKKGPIPGLSKQLSRPTASNVSQRVRSPLLSGFPHWLKYASLTASARASFLGTIVAGKSFGLELKPGSTHVI